MLEPISVKFSDLRKKAVKKIVAFFVTSGPEIFKIWCFAWPLLLSTCINNQTFDWIVSDLRVSRTAKYPDVRVYWMVTTKPYFSSILFLFLNILPYLVLIDRVAFINDEYATFLAWWIQAFQISLCESSRCVFVRVIDLCLDDPG